MKYFIKNMETRSTIPIVKSILINLGLNHYTVELGQISLKRKLTIEDYKEFKNSLEKNGLELLDDKTAKIIKGVKLAVNEVVRNHQNQSIEHFRHYLVWKINIDYNTQADVFSAGTGKSIEHYYLNQKIEYAKELLICTDLKQSEIARKLNYRNLPLFSRQFKKITGKMPAFFKHLQQSNVLYNSESVYAY